MNFKTGNLALNEFPQPTRPLHSYDITLDYSTPQHPYPHKFESSKLESSKFPYPQASDPISTSELSSEFQAQQDEHPQQQYSIDHGYKAEGLGERKDLAIQHQLQNLVLEMYEKLPASIREELSLEDILTKERFNKWQKSGVVNGSDSTSRGLQRPVDGFPEKLERFKIRTVVLEEGAKDDQKK